MSAVVCAIVIYEDLYLDEWIRYNLFLGFDHIYLYDNSPQFSLKDWDAKYPGKLTVYHYPGSCLQIPAYNKFLNEHKQHTWCAVLDADEFIVLKKHKTIKELLEEYCKSGALGLNWYLFGSSGHQHYIDEPVRKRFTHRAAHINQHVKTLGHIPSMSKMVIHHPVLNPNMGTFHDTNGKTINGPYNPNGPSDVAVIHHYFTKSKDEFMKKIERGMADNDKKRKPLEFHLHDSNVFEDVSAWECFPYA